MLGHSSIRTTALYWQNIHQEPDNDIGPILAGKKWLEKKNPPTTENFPQVPKSPVPVFIERKPVIPNKNSIGEDNSLLPPKAVKKSPEISTNEISPSSQEKFLLNNPSKKSDQLKITQPLAITTNKEQKPTQRELILLQRIKLLEKQLNQTTTERDNLKQLVQQEKQRAEQLETKLKTTSQVLYQLQKNTVLSETKINLYKQLEQEQKAQIEQSLKPPPNFKK
jgi:hypothetical protein